jgi:hypothetical protein
MSVRTSEACHPSGIGSSPNGLEQAPLRYLQDRQSTHLPILLFRDQTLPVQGASSTDAFDTGALMPTILQSSLAKTGLRGHLSLA